MCHLRMSTGVCTQELGNFVTFRTLLVMAEDHLCTIMPWFPGLHMCTRDASSESREWADSPSKCKEGGTCLSYLFSARAGLPLWRQILPGAKDSIFSDFLTTIPQSME